MATVSSYGNYGTHHFEKGQEIDGFSVLERDARGTIRYALATAISGSTGDVYMLRYKLNSDGEKDTICSCPANSEGSMFCKHQAALISAVDADEEDAHFSLIQEQEMYAEFGMSYIAGGGLREDVSAAWHLWNQPA